MELIPSCVLSCPKILTEVVVNAREAVSWVEIPRGALKTHKTPQPSKDMKEVTKVLVFLAEAQPSPEGSHMIGHRKKEDLPSGCPSCRHRRMRPL